MTPAELHAARRTLGELWGLGRPLHASELGRALRLGGRDPGSTIRDYERGRTPISGPISVAVEMMLRGSLRRMACRASGDGVAGTGHG